MTMDAKSVRKLTLSINSVIALLVIGLMIFFYYCHATFLVYFSIPTLLVYLIGYVLILKQKLFYYVCMPWSRLRILPIQSFHDPHYLLFKLHCLQIGIQAAEDRNIRNCHNSLLPFKHRICDHLRPDLYRTQRSIRIILADQFSHRIIISHYIYTHTYQVNHQIRRSNETDELRRSAYGTL